MLKNSHSPDSIPSTSPFSISVSNYSSSISQNNSPQFITSATYKKPTTKHVTELSTSSPAGLAVAGQVTPQRLAHLLSITGPLAIRHITSNLSKQIEGFDKLSLSKQRRLIMSSLNQGYQQESIVFEKIGWGQWSAKKVDAKDFIKERNSIRISNAKVKDEHHHNQDKDFEVSRKASINTLSTSFRRESITKGKYEVDHHEKFLKKSLNNDRNDFAILSDDEEDDDNEEDEDREDEVDDDEEEEEEEDGVFKFEDEDSIPPLKLNSRLVSPPIITTRRLSNSTKINGGISKPQKSKRSNSQTPTSPELLYTYSNKSINRRHSSIRSTLTDAISKVHNDHNEMDNEMNGEDTDEEDWASIGALKLLKSGNNSLINFSDTKAIDIGENGLKKDEQDAAFALVNLRSI